MGKDIVKVLKALAAIGTVASLLLWLNKRR